MYLTPLQRKKLGIEVIEPKDKKARAHHEDDQQESAVLWLQYQWAKYKDNFCAVPNGGKRDKKEAIRLKKQGVLAGWPDLQLMVARKGYHGLFLEGKWEDEERSPNQERVGAALEREGYLVVVFRSKEDFMDAVNDYLNE